MILESIASDLQNALDNLVKVKKNLNDQILKIDEMVLLIQDELKKIKIKIGKP